jgi:hypothetical protein
MSNDQSKKLLELLKLLQQEFESLNTFIIRIQHNTTLIISNDYFREVLIIHRNGYFNTIFFILDALYLGCNENLPNYKSKLKDLRALIGSVYVDFNAIFDAIRNILQNKEPFENCKVTLDKNLQNIREKIPQIETYINFNPDDNLFNTRTPYQIENDLAGAEIEKAGSARFMELNKGGRRIKKRTRRHKKKRGKRTRKL